MKFLPRQSMLCERGREWISLRLDGELSELAQKMLDSHLARCAECRAFETDVTATAELVRAAPLERLERPVTLPRGRRLAFSTRRLTAAAASVAAVAFVVVASTNLPASAPVAGLPSLGPAVSDNGDLQEQKLLRATTLRPPLSESQIPHGAQET